MPSILVRLRQRAISQSTTGSHHSAGSSSHLDPSASSPELAAIQEQGRSPAASPISRRIVHDISGLLDSYSPETDSNPGLRPPRPRKRSTVESTQSDEEDKRTVQELEGGSKSKQDQDRSTRESGPSTSQAVPQDLLSRRPTKSRLARFTPQLPSGGWSTFGRNKDQDAHRAAQYSPPPSASQSRKGSADSSAPRRQTSTKIGRSKFGSISSFQRYANRSFASVNAPHSQSNAATISRGSSSKYSNKELDIANQPPSPPLTTSSRQNSTKKSSVTHSSHSQLPHVRHAIPPSSEAKGSGIDSPRTFGALTPPIQSASFGPIPPLPPFPPFISGLSSSSLSRSLTLTHAVPNFTSTPRRWNAAVHGKTYPPRRRRKVVAHPTQDENTVPFPSGDRDPTGRTLRGFSSLPRVREIFTQPSNSSDEARLRARTISSGGSSRRRSKTTSSRRSSAEWSAHQASAGVSSPAPGQFGWPAEVAREMFRMTFGGGPLVAADSLSRIGRAGDSGDAGPRGEHAMGAKKQGSALLAEAASFPSFDPCFDGSPAHQGPLQGPLQETHLSQQPPSSALQGSSMGSSTAAVQLSLMHELADSQNDPLTSSGQTGSHSRRGDSSLIGVGSVVEGDISEMLSPGSSVRTRSSTALRSSSPRRASSMPKSAHPHTPRRGILTSTTQPEAGPSTTLLQNHLLPSPSTTPMRSSSRPKRSSSEPGLSSVLESPVTPTGKGKRKAEEVVDITPPDQKAGQRATFLIPENSRRTSFRFSFRDCPSKLG